MEQCVMQLEWIYTHLAEIIAGQRKWIKSDRLKLFFIGVYGVFVTLLEKHKFLQIGNVCVSVFLHVGLHVFV